MLAAQARTLCAQSLLIVKYYRGILILRNFSHAMFTLPKGGLITESHPQYSNIPQYFEAKNMLKNFEIIYGNIS